MDDSQVLKKKTKLESIFVDNAKIQKRRYLTLLEKSREKKLPVTATSQWCDITHIVTECSHVEDFLHLKKLAKEDIAHCYILKTQWLSECIRNERVIDINDEHIVPYRKPVAADPAENEPCAEYECQRKTPLNHCNVIFTRALQVLEKEATLRGDDENDSRALAFRRGMCTIASLPQPIHSMASIRGKPHIGKHIEKVIKDILQNGFSQEAADIESDDWFKAVKEFNGVFGVGPATAQKWYNAGMRSVKDVLLRLDGNEIKDSRLIYGLAFHEDLSLPVLKSEANFWEDLIRTEAERILPGVTVTLTGGFSRGKEEGHDIDLLLSHPNEGEEKGLLSKILSALEEQDFIIYGKHEEGTFNSSVLHSGHKGVANRSQLDHFEKWLGIVKIDACHRNKQEQKGLENKHQGLASPDQLASKDDRSEANGPLVDALRIAHKSRPWIARRVDLILVPHPQFAYAHLGWIGSRMFNRSIRRYADKEMNMKLTSHGLYDYAKKQSLPAKTQEDIFNHLKLAYIEPHDRNC